jgi:dimethylhistidine N-methyltransferase
MSSERTHETIVTDGFADDVARGLSRMPKRLSCIYLYDEEGSSLFEQICELPEYYPTRAEREILTAHAHEIAQRMPPTSSLVELGSGSARKTRTLIEALLAAHGSVRYLPIDVSPTMLMRACSELAPLQPGLQLVPLAADYEEGMRRISAAEGDRTKLILWLGSSIGNFEPREAAEFLARVRRMTEKDDRLLVGIDLRKEASVLERAYADSQGTTARFNRNLLVRINRELDGHFQPSRFAHRALFDEQAGCVRMLLVSEGAQRVDIERLAMTVTFADGEAIHTESSYKYRLGEIDALAAAAGLQVEERWLDRTKGFSLNLFTPRPRPRPRR